MKIVITGGAGFIGDILARHLLETGGLMDNAGQAIEISQLVLCDLALPETPIYDARVRYVIGSLTDRALMEDALDGASSVFHFASVVSGGAEADLDLGYSVNLDGSRLLLDILAKQGESGSLPKLVFASSFAVYSQGKEEVNDATTPTPKSSYGVQKLCVEHIVGDYARRGLVDGLSLRFPTVAVRAGKANLANSSFISNIIREPAQGCETVCVVPPHAAITIISPRKLIEAIIAGHNVPQEELGWPKALLLPAINVTVAQMLDALEAECGAAARQLVSFDVDENIFNMVENWPQNIAAARAERLGMSANQDAGEIVREFLKEVGL